MTLHCVDLDLDGALAHPQSCPTCLSCDLSAVHGGTGVVFVCPLCHGSWVLELGTLRPTTMVVPPQPRGAVT